MDTFKSSDPDHAKNRDCLQAAFSLVEVTMAIGIVAFVFTSILGLVQTGVTTFRNAMDVSLSSQIAQRVINEAQQTDFDQLVAAPDEAGFKQFQRYFDEQGNEVEKGQNSPAIYHVNMRVRIATELPTTTDSPIVNTNLALVSVQVANNPDHLDILTNPSTRMWKDKRLSIGTWSVNVSRNQ